MNWFRNLNATPRLLLSFGLLIALLTGISYFSITSLNQANERLSTLYTQDMVGAIEADKIGLARLSIGRQGRDALLNIADPAVAAADKDTMLADFAALHASLDAAEKLFYSKEGMADMAAIRGALPDWERGYHRFYERIDARDGSGAKAELDKLNQLGLPLSAASERASALKEKLGEDKFQANNLAYQSARSAMLSATVIAIVLGILLSIFIARGFAVPLRETVTALEMVAGGDLTVSVAVRSTDEVGRMAAGLNTALEKVRSTLQEVAESAAHSGSSSRELAAAAEAIATGAQEQAASLEEISAAIRQSADNARHASQLALGSRESAETGQEVVTGAIAAMAELNVASAKISDIISTINEIAFQTNLLAVNAAVEAARAGEEGRGFAVVATEVRSLAQRSAEAAKEIKGLIQDSLQKVEKGSELVNRSGTTLQGIVGSVKKVTDIVGEMSAASSEQSIAVTQMDQVTQSNSAQTEELAATAQSFAEEAVRLAQLVGRFKLGNQSGEAHANSGFPTPRRAAKAVRPGAAKPARLNVSVPPASSPVLVGSGAGRSDDTSFEEY